MDGIIQSFLKDIHDKYYIWKSGSSEPVKRGAGGIIIEPAAMTVKNLNTSEDHAASLL
jgi:hypothetical protein